MKKIAFVLLLSLFIFASCKKDNSTPVIDDTPVELPTHIDGYFKNYVAKSFVSKTDPLQTVSTSYAYFYSSNTASNFVTVDSILLNNKKMAVKSNNSYYSNDSLPLTCNWHVEGNNGIPDFDKSIEIPVFAGYAAIPDSIDLSKDFILLLNGISNTTSGIIKLYDVAGKNFIKQYKTGDISVTFTATELATFNKYSNFYLYIDLWNSQKEQDISGKKITFETQFTIDKYLTPY